MAEGTSVSARVLYSKDPAHKKRKRWKDGFLVGRHVGGDRVNLKLLDETGVALCSRSGLRCPTRDDLCEDEGVVSKSFGSGGFQLQFDDFCDLEDVPGANGAGAEGEEGQEVGVRGGGKKTGPYTNMYQRRGAGAENLPPAADSPKAPQAVLLVQRKVFNRPRQVTQAKSALSERRGVVGPGPPSGERVPATLGRSATAEDEILALFQSSGAYQPPQSLAQSQRSNDSLQELVYNQYEDGVGGAHHVRGRRQVREGGGRGGGDRNAERGAFSAYAASAGASSGVGVSDWSTKKPKLAQKSFQAPRVAGNGNPDLGDAMPGPSQPVGRIASVAACSPFSGLTFQVLKDRLVVPTKFAGVAEYKRIWMAALVEEVQLQLGEVKNKLQNFSKYGKGKKPSWMGVCRIAKYEKKPRPGEEREPPKYFMIFDKKPFTKGCAMMDMWILGSDYESLCTSQKHGLLVKSLWHGPSSDDKLQIEPLGKLPPLHDQQWIAIRGPNLQSEVQMIELFDKLEDRTSPLLKNVMGGTDAEEASASGPAAELPESFAELFNLNNSQVSFLKTAWAKATKKSSTETISILHGPFGSGKTTVIVALVILLVKYSSEQVNVLISANTNVAVDHILNGLIRKGFEDLGRIGSVRKIDPKLLKYTIHSKLDSRKEVMKELKEMIKVALPSDRAFYEEELRVLQNKTKTKNLESLSCARVVGVTCHSSTNSLLDDRKFDIVILDECSQIIEPLSMVPILRSKASHLIAVGDPHQLPPVVASPARSRSGGPTIFRPLFSRLLQLGYPSTLLDTQYRCHPCLGNLANILFYGGRLKNGCSEEDRQSMIPGCHPLVLCDCKGKDEYHQGGIFNVKEAKLCVDIFEKVVGWGIPTQEIGILCFYREQVNRVRQLIEGKGNQAACLIGTVDSFQGNEKSVIILTTCSPQGARQSKFCADANRLNVSLTRATHHLIIVGSRNVLSSQKTWSTIISRAQVFAPGEPFPVCTEGV
ncbi:P-loop nucleoside triphosphate hydrolase [Chloropicon primus]|nr:P-loop nucleoside triphosphate hydrolase [Chloropicon primus]